MPIITAFLEIFTVYAAGAENPTLSGREKYYAICKTEIEPLLIKGKGETAGDTFYVFVDTYDTPREVQSLIRSEFGCYYCVRETKEIYGIFDANLERVFFGKRFFETKNLGEGVGSELYTKIATASQNDPISRSAIGIKVILPSFNTNRDTTEYVHWGFTSKNVTTSGKFFTESEVLEKAFWRYRSILENCFSVLEDLSIKEMMESIELFKKCASLEETTYGSKFLPAADWIFGVLKRLEEMLTTKGIPIDLTGGYRRLTTGERYQIWVRSLARTFLTKDSTGIVAPVIQTAKDNVLDLLKLANSEKEMIVLIKERLNPLTYKRPVAAPSLGNVNIALNKLGEFQNTVLTVEKLEQLSGCFTLRPVGTVQTSLDGFAKLSAVAVAAKGIPISTTKSFAAKCRGTLPPNATFSDLIAYLKANPSAKLEVNTTEGASQGWSCGTFIVETTLARELRKNDLFWAFMRNKMPQSRGMKTVTHIFEYLNNIFFILDGPVTSVSLGGCCFPEFLDFAVERENVEGHLKVLITCYQPSSPKEYLWQ